MRISTKITLGLVVLILCVVGIDSYLTLHDELRELDRESHRDATMLAIALRAVVEDAEVHEGHQRAVEILGEVSRSDPELAARIVRRGEEGHDEEGRIVAFVPLHSAGGFALEVTRSTTVRDDYIQHTVRRTIVIGLILVTLAGLCAIVLGSRLVAKPLSLLVHAARQIAVSKEPISISLKSGDELDDLASEMTQMSQTIVDTRMRAEREAEARVRALEQLRHAERLAVVGRMAAGLAHELGTPLNIIAGRAELIDREGSEQPRRHATIIRKQTQRISLLVNQLLRFARKQPVERSRMDVKSLVERVVDAVGTVMPEVTILIRGDSAEIDADRAQLEQVITNLLINARDADSTTVWIEVRDEESSVALRIRDNGSGMSRATREAMFDPFYTTKDVGQGTGLGLSVSLGIVQEHGGWFEVESALDEGTTIDIFFPKH